MIITIDLVERFLFVFVLTFIYGLQRQRSHKPVGFGTFILVATGACALTITATIIDLSESIVLLSAIVTSIGFLGAGALIKGSDRIFGFTTAAGIWVFAIFGVIVGLGYFSIATIMYALIWVVIGFDGYLEKRGLGSYRKKITIVTSKFVDKDEIANTIAKYCSNQTLINIHFSKKQKQITLNYLIEGLKKDIDKLLKEFYKKSWCVSVNFE